MSYKNQSNLQARLEFPATPILMCLVFMARLSGAAALASHITSSQWHALNTTVSGRLHADGAPFARACFQAADGLSGGPDAAACAAVQAQYTSVDFREQAYGSYMNVGIFAAYSLLERAESFAQPQWETCQATGDGCLLNWQNTTDPLAFDSSRTCKLGSVSKYYVSPSLLSWGADLKSPADRCSGSRRRASRPHIC